MRFGEYTPVRFGRWGLSGVVLGRVLDVLERFPDGCILFRFGGWWLAKRQADTPVDGPAFFFGPTRHLAR